MKVTLEAGNLTELMEIAMDKHPKGTRPVYVRRGSRHFLTLQVDEEVQDGRE